MRMRRSHVATCCHSRNCTCACLPAATGGQIEDEPLFVANRFDVSQLRAPTPWTPPPEHPPQPVPKGPQPLPKVQAVPRSGESLQALVPPQSGRGRDDAGSAPSNVSAHDSDGRTPQSGRGFEDAGSTCSNVAAHASAGRSPYSLGVGARTHEAHLPMWQHMLRPVAHLRMWQHKLRPVADSSRDCNKVDGDFRPRPPRSRWT